jgi:hypothetical protein
MGLAGPGITESNITQDNGTVVDTINTYNPSGGLSSSITATVSANGLVKTMRHDSEGKNYSSASDTTVLDANGVRTTDSLIARFSDGTTPLDQAFSETLTHFGNAVPINLLNNITGGVSDLLQKHFQQKCEAVLRPKMRQNLKVELANALGLDGFAAGAFTTVGTTITTLNAANDNGWIIARKCG